MRRLKFVEYILRIKGAAVLSFKNQNILLFLICVLVLSCALAFYATQPLVSDVSYFVAASKRILQGEVPYVDLYENNPPLAFWFTLPAVWFAALINQNAETVFVVFVILLVSATLLFIWKLHGLDSRGDRYRQYLVLVVTVVLSFCLAFGFGQREYFATLLLLPYISSVALRSNHQNLPSGFALPLGAVAGIGASFKPHFILIPVFIEIFWLSQHRDWRLLFRVELLIGLALVIIYPALVWWFYPSYFIEILPLTLLTYSAYHASYAAIFISSTFIIFVGAALLVVTTSYWTVDRDRGILVWSVAALAGVIIHFVQHMGWPYHLLPGLAFITIALLLSALQLRVPILKLAICFLVFLSISLGLSDYQRTQIKSVIRFDRLLNGAQPKRMMMLTYELGAAFPFMPAHQIEWVGRYQSLWPMVAVEKNKLSDVDSQIILTTMARNLGIDISEQKPDFIIIDHRPFSGSSDGGEDNPIDVFSRFDGFKSVWAHYVKLNDDGAFQLWQRQ